MNTAITCPKTGATLSFDLPGDEATLANHWHDRLQVACPLCEEIHVVPYRKAYVTGVMSEFTCVPTDVRQATVH